MLGTILRSCYVFKQDLFFAEAARLGEARTEAGTYQQLTCSFQTGTAVAFLKMWGDQYKYVLDDRDITEDQKVPRYDNFVHLQSETVKLIVYSTIEGTSEIRLSNAYFPCHKRWFDEEKNSVPLFVRDINVNVRKGLNVICLCQHRGSSDYPRDYQRTTVESRGSLKLLLHPTPDLHVTVQAVILTDSAPLSLADMSVITAGFRYLRREDDVREWEQSDWWVKRIHDHRASELALLRLTWPQKVLLMYNTTSERSHSCCEQFQGMVGHFKEALSGAEVEDWSRAFNWDFVEEHRDRFEEYDIQWEYMKDTDYWTSVTSSDVVHDYIRQCHGFWNVVAKVYPFW